MHDDPIVLTCHAPPTIRDLNGDLPEPGGQIIGSRRPGVEATLRVNDCEATWS
ncbi:hypothetical protein KOR42_50090 [Thalassoglobus neptunius]|uniref:Uncharacterized protein n=1 Tax=Thalassoglobus neptunius TaxID=1938619 RepID=A0A5C5VN82_9PLAN|nr:hypothetical protein KOR42_50090 [Thalassoglobus neptunius]